MLIILIGRDPQTNQCASSILKPKSRHWRKHRFEYSCHWEMRSCGCWNRDHDLLTINHVALRQTVFNSRINQWMTHGLTYKDSYLLPPTGITMNHQTVTWSAYAIKYCLKTNIFLPLFLSFFFQVHLISFMAKMDQDCLWCPLQEICALHPWVWASERE